MFFSSPEIDCFFSEIGNNLMRDALSREMRGLNLMRALILNREKNHSGLLSHVWERLFSHFIGPSLAGQLWIFCTFIHVLRIK